MIVTSLSKYRATILKLSYQESALNLSTIPQFRPKRPALSNGPKPIPFPSKRQRKSPCQPQGLFCSVCAYHLAFVNVIPQFQRDAIPHCSITNLRGCAGFDAVIRGAAFVRTVLLDIGPISLRSSCPQCPFKGDQCRPRWMMTARTAISAGLTPGIRDACASVSGLHFFSFSRLSNRTATHLS